MDNPVAAPAVPSQDERIMAALAHISLVIPYVGMVVPAIVWITQKDKSRWVGFQALQALAYQLALMLLWFMGIACYMVSFFGTMFTFSFSRETSGPPAFFFLPFLVFGTFGLVAMVAVVYAIAGAVSVFTGHDFHYIVLGDFVARYMDRSHSDR